MTYKEILDFLYGQLPMFQRTGPAAYKDNLDNTHLLDAIFDHPHHNFRTIHVAGTNGKGSVSHMLASVLHEAGYKTGLYTSPHLIDFRERIKINGEMIPESEVVSFTEKYLDINREAKIEPSFFELTVAMAFDYFSNQKVDIAVIEVGLGGRLDSTNIIKPEISVITNISFDHQALLGNTLEKIAKEKAGIIKKGVPVVIGEFANETASVFIQTAARNNSGIFFAGNEFYSEYSMQTASGKQILNIKSKNAIVYPELKLDLLGFYQRFNVATVIKTIEILNRGKFKIQEKELRAGLENTIKNTGLMGRWQIIGNNPLIICDTGHNQAGIKNVVEQINQTAYKVLHFIIGMVNDKDQNEVLALLPKNAVYYFTKASIPRAANPKELETKALIHNLKGDCYESVEKAISAAKLNAGENDLIFIGGSTFVVAEALSLES